MILAIAAKRKRVIAATLLALMYFETIVPSYALSVKNTFPNTVGKGDKKEIAPYITPSKTLESSVLPVAVDNDGGPTQPETDAFHSIGTDNMVDLFSGDFHYTIPLIDVGGYPLTLGYNSGITMDQEASWVGLGWNLNPGSITRNMRGLPDDFDGRDSVSKTLNMKPSTTIGASVGFNSKIFSIPLKVPVNIGVKYNNYRGWGLDAGVSLSAKAYAAGVGDFTGKLTASLSSMDGFSLNGSLSLLSHQEAKQDKGGFGGYLSLGLPFSSREGMKSVQYSAGVSSNIKADRLQKVQRGIMADDGGSGLALTSSLSFVYPSFTPEIQIPYTVNTYSGSFAMGPEAFGAHVNLNLAGYVSKQFIAKEDQTNILPAYGYLHYGDVNNNENVLLDFNRERDIPASMDSRSIGLPSYTYDVFSIAGEGIGGVFRPYRNDIGYVYDHYNSTRNTSSSGSLDIGAGALAKIQADLEQVYTNTTNRAWKSGNPTAGTMTFSNSYRDYEAVYMRNPGEMSVNNPQYFETLGGDDILVPELTGNNTANIRTTNNLIRYKGGVKKQTIPLTSANVKRNKRDRRSQVISYLTAEEAQHVGLSTYIENYDLNIYSTKSCDDYPQDNEDHKNGFVAYIYNEGGWVPRNFAGVRLFKDINFTKMSDLNSLTIKVPGFIPPNEVENTVQFGDKYPCSIIFKSWLKAPVTGEYLITNYVDDEVYMSFNDSLIVDTKLNQRPVDTVRLEAGKYYRLEVKFNNHTTYGNLFFKMTCKGTDVKPEDFYLTGPPESYRFEGKYTLESRVSGYRKPHHISEISVLNTEGQRYVYGIPVYNFKQKDLTFSINKSDGDLASNTSQYVRNQDNTVNNKKGGNNYFSKEEVPAYAHSFLLTGILSPDYVDLTGDGITPDDLGTAIKFNYTKIAGRDSAYMWRVPYDSVANYNEGFKSDDRDDKASYVYGEKELWYLNSIVSKNYVAVFQLGNREDLMAITEDGHKLPNGVQPKKLEEIRLYSKAEFAAKGVNATPIKTVHFEYNYELCPGVNKPVRTNGKLTLKKVWFTYNGNKAANVEKDKRNAYVFHYSKNNPSYDHKSFDRWGNYKNSADNPNGLLNSEYPYALQDSAVMASNAAAWALDSIKLPNGGRLKINYESDDYAYVQNRKAAVMTAIAGLSSHVPQSLSDLKNHLYETFSGTSSDNLYVSFHVSKPVKSKEDIQNYYLRNINDTMFFRLNVKVPGDNHGEGYEYIPCYGFLEPGSYGYYNNGNTIYVKLKSVDIDGDEGGRFSPLANAAVQFLKVQLPSKAHPGSDVGDDVTGESAIKTIVAEFENIPEMIRGFGRMVRAKGQMKDLDLTRSFARLSDPTYKKYGGGHRVKSIVLYDHWNAMTGQKESIYGTAYQYTTTEKIGGKDVEISSGVANYEPVIGGDDNPFHTPIITKSRAGLLVPDITTYIETPLGEGFFPSPGVGYRKVKVFSIHNKKVKSLTGYKETCFYTSYDFPTIAVASEFDRSFSKMNYHPFLFDFLKFGAKNFLALSQGVKVELNDMHGKLKSEFTYAEGDDKPISSVTNYYHVDNEQQEFKHLNNKVLTMSPTGIIDSAFVGMDLELMADMKEQKTNTVGLKVGIGLDIVPTGFPISILNGYGAPQWEELAYKAASMVKVINRHGILDSMVVTQKGSKVVTKNLLYDSETGDVLLTATQNEFNDPVYSFNYPAAWVYDGMSGAYKNIGATIQNVTILEGKLVTSLSPNKVEDYFTSGDEILVYANVQVTDEGCNSKLATFPGTTEAWAIDANVLTGGAPDIYFLTREGKPITGYNMTLKIIRSGRRNITGSVGNVTMLKNPLMKNGSTYTLSIDETSGIINAAAAEFKQNWHVTDKKGQIIKCIFQ